MKLGLSLSGLLQHDGDADMVQRFADVLDLVRLARELGFEYIYTGHHYLSHPYQMMQPLPSLARISAETGDMDLLSTILMPLQNPVRLAEEVATLDLVRDVELNVKIELGRTHMHLEEVLKLRKGSVVPLDKLAGDPVDVYVNDRLVARGEVLVLNDNFCVRIADLIAGEKSVA